VLRQAAKGDEAMPGRIDKPDVVRLVMQRTGREQTIVEEVLDAALEEIYAAFTRGESVSLRNFGSFYVRPETAQWVFRFNPAQRLRKLFGWSSTYHGVV
jgi:DNA-binding protein HU-beta